MGELVVVICTFNYRLWKKELPELPVMSELAEVELPAYASSTWTIPGTIAIMTGKQDWENPQNPDFAWRNIGWSVEEWENLHPTYGEDDIIRLLCEWDGEGTAFLFIRTMHFPYGISDQVALKYVAEHDVETLEAVYTARLHRLDRVLEPLLQLDTPLIIVGDHGEDFSEHVYMHMHHNNHSDDVLRVPMFGRGINEYGLVTNEPVINKHTLKVLRNKVFWQSDVIRIWSEGPFDGEWKYITIDDKGKTIIDRNGMTYESPDGTCLFQSDSGHSKVNARLRALGYL
jgi:hypothetical protein